MKMTRATLEYRQIIELQVGYHQVTDRESIDSILATVGSYDKDVTGLIIRIHVEDQVYPEVWGYSGIPYGDKMAWLIHRAEQ